MENGDQVELSYEDSLGDRHPRKLLFFDTIEHVTMVGADPIDYLCFQKERSTLGNRSVAIPVLPSSVVKIFMIRGEEFSHGKKFRIVSEPAEEKVSGLRIQKDESKNSGSTSGIVSDPREKKPAEAKKKGSVMKDAIKPDFNIVEKDRRYVCPCGNDFKTKAHAVYHHKNHIKKQEGSV